MQNDDSRARDKRPQLWRIAPATRAAKAELRSLISNALILHPDMASLELAEIAIKTASKIVMQMSVSDMFRNLLYTMIQRQRKAQSMQDQSQFSLPGFEHLPRIIPTRNGGTMPLEDATYRRLRDYQRALVREHRQKRQRDARILELQVLMEKVLRYSIREQRITVRQVLLLDGWPKTA